MSSSFCDKKWYNYFYREAEKIADFVIVCKLYIQIRIEDEEVGGQVQ